MSALARDMKAAIEKTLVEHGVSEWDLSLTSGHQKYRFQWQDRTILFVTSGSPSDCKALHNAVSELRRVMGVKKAVRKNPANRVKPHKKRSPPLPKVRRLTILPDPWEKLKEVVITGAEPAVPHQSRQIGKSPWLRRALRWIRKLFS